MLASFCTRFGDVQSFIFCVRAGGRLISRGRFAPGYPTSISKQYDSKIRL